MAAIAFAFLGYTYYARMKQAKSGDFSGTIDREKSDQQFQPVENPLVISQMVDNMDDKDTYDRL